MIVHNEILQQIEETLNEKRFVTISAFAGAGKTTLAIKYGDRQTQAKKKIVRFINVDSADKVLEAYRQLAKEFTIYVIDEKEENIIRLVHERIANLNSAILFIFDNVEDHKDIEPYLNSIINILNDKAQVIITTKNNNLSDDIENIILVESFSKKEAILYLKKSLKNRLNKKDIDKLVEDFGSNDAASPYRLSKAVAYLKANKLLKVND
ncbi:MAG: ATP-binding protein [Rickettsia africae]|uniref:NB-ARC domain-containing protein n=2 Tax=spotted fever group TaxID=114277 RepID=C3PM47_RICAE|nr:MULTISPECIES: ATP-binding protein [spotted fever group]AAL02559.1 unknown [Rickettsia conorii str. Malish 7]ACP53007.1 Unknown [Rickettsia africae ESF-5]